MSTRDAGAGHRIENYTATQYDIALSFSSDDRRLARELCRCMVASGLSVYFDESNEVETVARRLDDELQRIYFLRCRHCVVIASQAYFKSHWAQVEWASIMARAKESGNSFLTLVSTDKARVNTGCGALLESVSSFSGVIDITHGVLRTMGKDKAFRSLRIMRSTCIFTTAIISLACVITFLANPGFALVHTVFAGLVAGLFASVRYFFTHPIIISLFFLFISVELCVAAHATGTDLPAMGIALIYLLFGVPGVVLAASCVNALWEIRKNRLNGSAAKREHPLMALRTFPTLVVLGAVHDPLYRPFCTLLKAIGFCIHPCSVPDKPESTVLWPNETNVALVVVSSQHLQLSLWNDEKRYDEFIKWRAMNVGTVVAVTTDGTLAPVQEASLGYIDTRHIGPFRTAIFMARAFTNKLHYNHCDHLRHIMLFMFTGTTITALYHIAVVLHNGAQAYHIDSAPVSWIAGSIVWAILWRRVERWQAISCVVLGCCGAAFLWSGLIGTATAPSHTSIMFLGAGIYTLANVYSVARGRISLWRAYRHCRLG